MCDEMISISNKTIRFPVLTVNSNKQEVKLEDIMTQQCIPLEDTKCLLIIDYRQSLTAKNNVSLNVITLYSMTPSLC